MKKWEAIVHECWATVHDIANLEKILKRAIILMDIAGGDSYNSRKYASGGKDVSRFAYKSIRLHRGRFAYMTKSFRLHSLSRFAYI